MIVKFSAQNFVFMYKIMVRFQKVFGPIVFCYDRHTSLRPQKFSIKFGEWHACIGFIWCEICFLIFQMATKLLYIKFRYSEEATKFWKKSPNFIWRYLGSSTKVVRFFSNLCGLLRLSELYCFLLDDKLSWLTKIHNT